MQFNHAILAISVPESIQFPAVLEKTPFGRLLMFDPTDPVTPLRDAGGGAEFLRTDRGRAARRTVGDAEAGSPRQPHRNGDPGRSGILPGAWTPSWSCRYFRPVRRYAARDRSAARAVELRRSAWSAPSHDASREPRSPRWRRRTNPAKAIWPCNSIWQRSVSHRSRRAGSLIITPGLLMSGGEYYFSKGGSGPARSKSTPTCAGNAVTGADPGLVLVEIDFIMVPLLIRTRLLISRRRSFQTNIIRISALAGISGVSMQGSVLDLALEDVVLAVLDRWRRSAVGPTSTPRPAKE